MLERIKQDMEALLMRKQICLITTEIVREILQLKTLNNRTTKYGQALNS